MPNNKQSKKRLRQDELKRQHNKIIKSSMRTAVKKVTLADTQEAAEEALPIAEKRIDKALKANIIHANAAARLKSRLRPKIAAKG